MKQLALIIASSFLLFSCSEQVDAVDKSLEVKTYDAELLQNTTALPIDSNLNSETVEINSASTPAGNSASQSVNLKEVNLSNPALKPAVAGSVKGLNPPHGQPNHRCDIAVGEPLSTPVKPAPVQNITQGATQNAPQVITTPNPVMPKVSGSSTAKLNPPHGEPGHDCAIQVGAPLN